MTATKDPNAPASKQQRWALFCIYKQDYRETKITYAEASELIAAGNLAKTPKFVRGEFKEYFLSDQVITRMANKMADEMGIKSIVMNDLSMLPDDGKRYAFFGGGCGFSHISWDKRSKLGEQIMKEFGALRPEFEKRLMTKFDPEYLKKMQASGNPLQAHLFQNLAYNTSLNYVVSKFMEEKGVKKVSVSSRYD